MEKKLKISQIILLGLIILSVFFGAGNLVMPPIIGLQSGKNFLKVLPGFLITSAGLPFISLFAFAAIEGNISTITDKFSKNFTFLYITITYLIAGPFFAVPRTAIVATEIAIIPFINQEISHSLILFMSSAVYFLFSYICSKNPSKSLEICGRYVIPILFIIIFVLIVNTILYPQTTTIDIHDNYKLYPFFNGMLSGFLTADALGTFIIVRIINNKLKDMGITKSSDIIKNTILGGIVALIIVILAYTSLAYIGSKSTVDMNFTNGSDILVQTSTYYFGKFGCILLSLSVIIACFTTAFPLIISISNYLHSKKPSISYNTFLKINTFISFCISNLGFNILLKFIFPILELMYSITIIIVIFTIFKKYTNNLHFKFTIILCLIFNFIHILYKYLPFKISFLSSIMFF